MKTEADLQACCFLIALEHGCIAGKVNMDGRRGWPDGLFLFPGGHVWFVEFKHPNGKGKLRPQQEDRRDAILALNGDWSEIDNITDFKIAFAERFGRATGQRDYSLI